MRRRVCPGVSAATLARALASGIVATDSAVPRMLAPTRAAPPCSATVGLVVPRVVHRGTLDAMASKKRDGEPPDLSTRILIQIRDEIHKTNERLDRLERRQTEDSVRLATELVGVAKAVAEVRDLLRDNRLDRKKIEDHERRIAKLERRSA